GLVRRVGHTRCNVLIVGERGTGRETIARAIRDQGPNKSAAFVKFVCSAIDRAAFIAALEAAAFTETTLYLEDLCELPLELQATLEARIAAGRERAPRVLGSPQPRVVELVQRGAFRASLLEAISVVRIDLPPRRLARKAPRWTS